MAVQTHCLTTTITRHKANPRPFCLNKYGSRRRLTSSASFWCEALTNALEAFRANTPSSAEPFLAGSGKRVKVNDKPQRKLNFQFQRLNSPPEIHLSSPIRTERIRTETQCTQAHFNSVKASLMTLTYQRHLWDAAEKTASSGSTAAERSAGEAQHLT